MEVLVVVIQLSPSYVNHIGGVRVEAHSIKEKGQRRVGSESE
jgi:hypothetical protein